MLKKIFDIKFKYLLDNKDRLKHIYWYTKCRFMESILQICFNKKDINRASHIKFLEEKIKNQAREISNMKQTLENRNIERKAMNILVACDGPCNAFYGDDPDSVTGDVVREVEYISTRLRSWYDRRERIRMDKEKK